MKSKSLILSFFTVCFFLFSSLAQGAPKYVPNGMDLLAEVPKWISEDKEANQTLRFEVPKLIPLEFPYATDPEDILTETKDYRTSYDLFEARTGRPLSLSDKDLIEISKKLKGDYLLYVNFLPGSPVNFGPWDNLVNPITIEVTLISKQESKVLFQKSYLCQEKEGDTIDLGIRMGKHYTRPGDPHRRLTPNEMVLIGLKYAAPEVKAFLNELAKEKGLKK